MRGTLLRTSDTGGRVPQSQSASSGQCDQLAGKAFRIALARPDDAHSWPPPPMTVLAALWSRDGRSGRDRCRTMIRSQWPTPIDPGVRQIGGMALGAGGVAHDGDEPAFRLVVGAAGSLAL